MENGLGVVKVEHLGGIDHEVVLIFGVSAAPVAWASPSLAYDS